MHTSSQNISLMWPHKLNYKSVKIGQNCINCTGCWSQFATFSCRFLYFQLTQMPSSKQSLCMTWCNRSYCLVYTLRYFLSLVQNTLFMQNWSFHKILTCLYFTITDCYWIKWYSKGSTVRDWQIMAEEINDLMTTKWTTHCRLQMGKTDKQIKCLYSVHHCLQQFKHFNVYMLQIIYCKSSL